MRLQQPGVDLRTAHSRLSRPTLNFAGAFLIADIRRKREALQPDAVRVRTKRPVSDLWRNVRNASASRCISMNSRQMRLATNTLARASKQANPRIAASRQGSPADPPCTAEPNRREQIQVFVDQPAWREHHVDGVRRCP